MHEQPVSAHPPAIRAAVSRWISLPYTVFAGAVVAVDAAQPGVLLFWFADIALIASVLALWYEQRLLASMAALAVLVPALLWNIGFFARLLGGVDPFGLASHLFEPEVSFLVRLASLAHVVLPVLLLWLVSRLGYDPRALPMQTLFGWAVLMAGVVLTPLLASSMDGTLAMGARLRQAWLPGWLWVALLMIAYPVLVYLPAHALLQELYGPARRRLARRIARYFMHRPRTAAAARPHAAGREPMRAPNGRFQARLRDFADFALVRRRRR